jgi:ElaA protein
MIIKCVPFYELSLDELYAIMVLRQEVFVLEQNCPFVDADGKDHLAWHFMIWDENNKLVAYTRLFDKNIYYIGYTSIGRVVTSIQTRGGGIGRLLMQKSIDKTNLLNGPSRVRSHLLPGIILLSCVIPCLPASCVQLAGSFQIPKASTIAESQED